jgi:hypothetical protein
VHTDQYTYMKNETECIVTNVEKTKYLNTSALRAHSEFAE